MKKLLLLVASLCVMLANSAGATIIVVDPPARVPDFTPGVFDWTYAAVLFPGQSMKPGDFFTIYDFPNANLLSTPNFGVTGADDNAVFAVSVQNTGATPPKTAPADNPNVSNVTVTLLDGDGRTAGTLDDLTASGGSLQLGTLIIRSPTKSIARSLFGSVLDKNSQDNPATSTIGPIDVAAIPEPGSLALLLVGLAACGAVSFRRKMVD
jgi:hypothetical protein